MDEPESVEPPARQLSAVGVDRELPAERDALPALDERRRSRREPQNPSASSHSIVRMLKPS